MKVENEITALEKEYLSKTLDFLNDRLLVERADSIQKKEEIITARRELYENTPSSAQDTAKLSEMAQLMAPLLIQTSNYHALEQRIQLFERMRKAPYFARIDFSTEQWGDEVIYIGLGNLENEETFDVYVYDWRAPISSLFYRYELGEASYQAPGGTIKGDVTLKRQFEIKNGALDYFFDSGMNIVDEILKKTLSQNRSPQMRIIVETIQREQDIIIRDIENDLVIVQGVAGSGKTSVALHRAAYLMYNGLESKLATKNLILISPNKLLEQYISEVLPELGENHIKTLTFEDIFYRFFPWEDASFKAETRHTALEEILTAQTEDEKNEKQQYYTYKTTELFLEHLDWLSGYYLKELVNFPDFTFGKELIADKTSMKQRALNAFSDGATVQVSLNQVKQFLRDKLNPAKRRERRKEIESEISGEEAHYFDYRATAREMLREEMNGFNKQIEGITTIDYLALYREMMENPAIVEHLSQRDPEFRAQAKETRKNLQEEFIPYVDAMALLYLRTQMDTVRPFAEIRQVLVDEMQDYSKIHFEIMHSIFPSAKYTILGDINQAILDTGMSSELLPLHKTIEKSLRKEKSLLVSLNKNFRCSHEISTFSAHFAEKGMVLETLERREAPVVLLGKPTLYALHTALVSQLEDWKAQGMKTLAVVCSDMKTSRLLFESLKDLIAVELLEEYSKMKFSKVQIMPVYLAKGLEFDAVAVYGVDNTNFYSENHRRQLYIACTRALHRLGVFYHGEASALLPAE